MGPWPRYAPRVAEHFDIVIVGAGPAGLAAGVRLSGCGRSFAIFEAGLAARRRDNPVSTIRGVGGAGLFSDGKFSFHPSATSLWQLRDEQCLKESFDWFRSAVAVHGLIAPEFPHLSAPNGHGSSSEFKTYPSFYMPAEQRSRFVESLARAQGAALRPATRVVAIREMADGFLLHVETRSGFQAVSAKTIIFAGGRFGSLDLSRMMPDIPMVFRRFEVGLRLEQPHDDFVFRSHPSVDVKQILPGEACGEEWRTFCTCRNGEVVETRWDELRTYSGRANGVKSAFSNIGVNLRVVDWPVPEPLLGELHGLVSGQVEPFHIPAPEFIGSAQICLGQIIDKKFRSRLQALLPPNALSHASVYGPCIEGIGFYPDVNDALKLNSHEIWIAGDAVGTFRGLTPALVSGHYCASQVLGHLRSARALPSFVKESSVMPMPVVFTAQSKAVFYCRDAICEYVLKQGLLPINPFRVFEYFLSDRVDRELVRQGNNQLIALADEIWVFGPVSDGVLFEVVRARRLRKPVRLFSVATRASEIRPISIEDVKFEPEVHAAQIRREDLIALLSDAIALTGKASSSQLALPLDEPAKKPESLSPLP